MQLTATLKTVTPKRRFAGVALSLAATLLSTLPAVAQGAILPGFEATSVAPVPGLGGAYATLDDGSLFLFDGMNFELYQSDGTLLSSLGSLPAFVFASFVRIDPTGTYALCGESSNNDVFKVDLSGGFAVLGNVPFAYDLVFDTDPGFALLSAALGGWGTGNDILRMDLSSGTYAQLAHVDGPSGPLALDPAGDLLLGWLEPFGATDADEIIKWTRAQLMGGVPLTKADAATITSGLNGPSSLAVSPVSHHIFVADNNFAQGLSTIVEVHPVSGAHLELLVDTADWLTTLEFKVNGGSGTFYAYQPHNVELRYNSTDFAVFTSDIVDLSPKRPSASLTGPSSGAGTMTLTITDAVPNAGVIVFFGAQGDMLSSEQPIPIGLPFPLFSSLHVSDLRRLPFITPTDGNGTANFQFFDPGFLHGTLVLQTIAVNGSGGIVGSSDFVLN